MLASVPASRLNQFLAVSETPRFSKIYPLQHLPSRQLRHLLVLVEVAFIGVEFTPDAASVFMAIVTSIVVVAMATVTTDTLATTDTMATMATMVTTVAIPGPLLA